MKVGRNMKIKCVNCNSENVEKKKFLDIGKTQRLILKTGEQYYCIDCGKYFYYIEVK